MLPLAVPSINTGINHIHLLPVRQSFTSQKPFFTHAALLRQGFPHCAKFLTAASRRSLDRVSVPVWLIILSDQLAIAALASLYLTNKLMARGLIPKQQLISEAAFDLLFRKIQILSGISPPFERLSRIRG